MTENSINNIIYKINEVLKNKNRISIISHYNPDGDAIGSSLALMLFLKECGKKTKVIIPNQIPDFLKWLPGYENVLIYESKNDECFDLIKNSEIIFCIDFSNLNRINKLGDKIRDSKAIKVLIDHHPNPEEFTEYIISTISVSSTAELVYELISNSDRNKINTDIAICIYTGIMTDTVDFRHNTSKRTFEIVAELKEWNINSNNIYNKVYDFFSENRMKLLGYALNKKLAYIKEYNTAYIYLTKKELKKYKFNVGDSEGFVNYPLSIKGVVFSALFIEKDNEIKISFRSKFDFEVNTFASKHFNGGGHKNAAGGKAYDSLSNTIKKFVNLLPEYSSQLNE